MVSRVEPQDPVPKRGSPEEAPQPERITWVHHPAREQPGRLALVTGVVLAFSLSVLWADGDLFMALLSAGILLVSLASFLLPTRYTLTPRGVNTARPGQERRLRWEEIRRWEEDPGGIYVSPFRTPQPLLEWRRAIYLRGGERELVRARLQAHLGAPLSREDAQL